MPEQKLVLRPYQQEAIDQIEAEIVFGSTNVILEASTGYGKGVVIAGVCQRFADSHIVIIVNIEPLIDQIADELKGLNLDYSILKAGRESEFDETKRINIVMSQTFYARVESNELKIKADLVLQDEIHKEYDTKRTNLILDKLKPKARIGYTATPYTSSGFALANADIVRTHSMKQLTQDGNLSPLKFYVPKWAEQVNYSKVKRSGSDYSMSSLDEVIGTPHHINHIIESMNQMNAKNKKTIIFASTIEMCEKLEVALLANNYQAAAYHSKKSKKENERIMKSFRHNLPYAGSDDDIEKQTLFDTDKTDITQIKCLISINKVAIGFSVKDLDLGVFVRKYGTRSLVVQSAGRICRTYTGLSDILSKHKKYI